MEREQDCIGGRTKRDDPPLDATPQPFKNTATDLPPMLSAPSHVGTVHLNQRLMDVHKVSTRNQLHAHILNGCLACLDVRTAALQVRCAAVRVQRR